jgi:RNA-directed DNA polymerase
VPQGAVASPLLAKVYLHDVFDLWVDASRKKDAQGDGVVVPYADDGVVGFERQEAAERFLVDLQARFRPCGLARHPAKRA